MGLFGNKPEPRICCNCIYYTRESNSFLNNLKGRGCCVLMFKKNWSGETVYADVSPTGSCDRFTSNSDEKSNRGYHE